MGIITLLAIINFLRRKDPAPIFGKYSQRGKWFYLKYIVFLCVLYIRKWRSGNKTRSRTELEEFDKPQELSSDKNGFNAVFYIGGNSKGLRMVFGQERRHQGIIHSVLYFLIPGKGLYKLPQLPDAMTFSTSDGESSVKFSGGGLLSEPREAMKRWRLSYRGDLLHSNGEIVKNCSFDGEFTSQIGYLDYDTDISLKAIAKSIATEPWSRKYFANLKTAHQSRIEQMGEIHGKLSLHGGEEVHDMELDGFRDLSYGHARNWSLMHRYAYFMIFLENGTRFSLIHVNQPCTGSNLKVGYVCLANGKYVPMDSSDFELYQHGEDGTPPQECAFQIEADGQRYTIQVNVTDQAEHYVGNNWEARMVERFIEVTVNGVRGYGVSEFHYNNQGGRPSAATDPQWYKTTTRATN